MQNPRHCEAFELFTAQPSKLRSEFVVSCILESQDAKRLEKMVRREVSEALKGIAISVDSPPITEANIQATENVSDLPDVLIALLEDL